MSPPSTGPSKLYDDAKDFLPVVLPEDNFLRGFSPLIEAQRMQNFYSHPASMVGNFFIFRVKICCNYFYYYSKILI